MKLLLPSCETCGREDQKEVGSREEVQDRLQRFRADEEALAKLLEKCIGERELSINPDAFTYREATLRRLLDKARERRLETECILALLS